MWDLARIKALNNKIISYSHKEVAKCRARCLKQCCINCDHFLACEVAAFDTAGRLFNLTCVKRESKIETWSGANECQFYLTPIRKRE